MTNLQLDNNSIGANGAKAIAEALKVNPVLTNCNLLKNNLDIESVTMLAKIGAEKGIMLSGMERDETEADFSSRGLEPADAILIVSDLKVNPVLTKLYLYNNNLGDAGEKAVREAVKDRSGFELCM